MKSAAEIAIGSQNTIGTTGTSTEPTALMGIVSSRKKFPTRAKAIMNTWAKEVPVGVTPIFFLGGASAESGIESGSPEDIAELSQVAGISETSSVKIVVMKGVPDDEYPPVYKNTFMLKHLNAIAEHLDEIGRQVLWVGKVDDDAYLHMPGMVRFLKTRDPTKDAHYGERGRGKVSDKNGLRKAGLTKYYCMGGSGWIMSRSTLRKTVQGMDECVADAYASIYRDSIWHSDTVIGLCVEKTTGGTCWPDDDYAKVRLFQHNEEVSTSSAVIPDHWLPFMVVMHPFKNPDIMVELYDRYQRLAEARKRRREKAKAKRAKKKATK